MRKLAMAAALAVTVAACGGGMDASADPPATTTATTVATTAQATTTAVPTSTAPTSTAPTTAPPITTAAPAAFPVTVVHSTGLVTLEAAPRAIVSLSPTATEILFSIGADAQVMAVDSQSNYPEIAPITDLSAFEPSVEAIAGFEPDLVVMSFDPGDIESGLTALGIPVIVQFAALSLEDAYSQIEQLGAATGNAGAAAALIADIRGTVDQLAQDYGGRQKPLTYYHELDNTFYSVTSATFIGELYSVVGLENVADPADAEGYGYPQLSPEFILEADPDLIFLADTKCCGQDAATLAARPGWDQLSAVRHGTVVALDDDVASRWGPRIVDFLEAIADAVARYEAVLTE